MVSRWDFLLFCSLALAIGLVWITLSYLNDREKLHEERLVGALNFTEEKIESELNRNADLYQPVIGPLAKANHWRLSGIVVSADSLSSSNHDPFTAVLENLCPDFAKSSCWRVEELVVAEGAH